MAANAHWWDKAAPALKPEFHPVALDFSGHGESPWKPDGLYDAELFAADIERARAALGWERFVLAGHSLGGRVALDYARRSPERLIAVAAVDFLCEFYQSKARRFERTRTRSQPVYPDEASMVSRFRLQPPGTLLSSEELRALARHGVKPGEGGWTWKFDWHAFRFDYRAVWPVLPGIKVPALIVRGEHSTVLSREEFARVVRELPGATGVDIPGAHHHVPLDAPQALAAALKKLVGPDPAHSDQVG